MNTKAFLVTAFLAGSVIALAGCGPERDILHRWTGTYVAYDDTGPLGFGCTVHDAGEQRRLIEWRYTPDGSIAESTHPLGYFDLEDHYSDNYGTFHPTWVYRYAPDARSYPQFQLHEYFDGDIEARLVETGRQRPVSLRRVNEIPRILQLREGDLPSDLEALRELDGRHFWMDARIGLAERRARSGYVGTVSVDLFGDSFIDHIELSPVAVGPWEVHPVLRSPVIPITEEDAVPLPATGSHISGLIRLVQVRQKAGANDHAVVLVYRYQPGRITVGDS